ncbi:MAG: hypothetical protein WDZ80_04920 [Candidatus Paceibacterota bacterium]
MTQQQPTAPTQDFVKVKDIRDSVLYMKDGSMRKILIVNGINFDLKSQEEQNLILGSFQSFLNTLDFSVQFFIHSRKINVNSYLEKVKEKESEEDNELLKIQITEYIEFIKSFVQENPIITKSFFVVVPYSPNITVDKAKKGIMDFFNKGSKKDERAEGTQESLQQLAYRENEVISGLDQIGLRAQSLADEELVELFYNLYNPEIIEKKGSEVPKISKNN